MYSVLSTIKRLCMHSKQLFLQIALPAFCYGCAKMIGESDVGLCTPCQAQIRPIMTTDLTITKQQSVPVFAVSEYVDPLKKLVLAKSHSDIKASRILGQLMWEKTSVQHIQFDFIVPIALHWSRYAKRGYNQAYEMAVPLSRVSGKPIRELLKRTKKTEFQFLLPYEQRAQNLKEAFELTTVDESFKEKVILLVDDVMTSGSTLVEAVKALRPLKPKAIYAVVACKTLYRE